MEANLERIRLVIASAIEKITTQKDTIVELKNQLASVSEEYAATLEAEGIEDAQAEAFLSQLDELSNSLSTVVDSSVDSVE
ncbi:MAG: hypothetical protein CUR32_01055 [Flavobacterium sp.]|nr:MAG: hypothetical protein CUR32_01055 [Flavobacterium sp.] [Flavobacterium sp. FEMGT703F]